MPKKQTTGTKRSIPMIIAAIVLILYLWYTMPKTMEQLYPYLDLSECTGITVWYEDGTSTDMTEVKLTAKEAAPLLELFESRTFRRTLSSIFPRGTWTHQTTPGSENDFQWELIFFFEDVTLPDGSGGSGALLHFNNFYGKLEVSSDDKGYHHLTTSGKDAWLQEVMDAILTAENG